MIELKDVSCSFSDRLAHKGRFTAVSSMTANFEDGGRYAIVGESGSGKTTPGPNDCRAAAPQHRGDFCGRFSGLWTDKGGKRTFQKSANHPAKLRFGAGPQTSDRAVY